MINPSNSPNSLKDTTTSESKDQTPSSNLEARDFSDKISHALQPTTAQGLLCNEPVQGIAVFLEKVILTPSVDDESPARLAWRRGLFGGYVLEV
ncbi:hypothetical protein F5882DRAFT_40712 [Hyaloscypha sp. PMI_1271]|nr:hypothetical protein F5882DRAFT_148853 [Hyaloscypha sp. PMI_1271]KAH8795051.1 hypothetical protein F5882DRAFT_40712 [Hyaloscypha sp. PMI_1271]